MSPWTVIRDSARGLATSWFGLTRDEQAVILAIAAIFLIGLAARSHHGADRGPERASAPSTAISTAPGK